MAERWWQQLHALLLALASSTDNFAVGVSVGVKRQSLCISLNGFIALCNALGAMLAATVGGAMTMTTAAPLLASAAFAYLGYQELRNDDNFSSQHRISYSLALPMTLNNLAGGVAGGAAGIQPSVAFLYAFGASLVAMSVGHALGWKFANRPSFREGRSGQYAAGLIYCLLSIATFFEACR